MKGFPGWISDRRGGRRKPWLVGGYGATGVARVMLAAAPAWGWVLAARTLDRFGQALRAAPRDALISDSTPAAQRGAAFGFYRSVDTLGSILGALGAFALLAADAALRTILWVAAVPGLASLVLLRRVRDVEGPLVVGSTVLGPTSSRLRALPRSFWVLVGIWFLFSLGNSSDVFLILRAHNLGLSLALAVLAYFTYNVVQSGLAWPLGSLSDRIERSYVISAGLAVFALVYLGFAYAPGGWAVWPLFAIYGGYIAATEGVARAWVADHAPAGAAGTAYGVFAVTTGVGILAASTIAGILWTHVSARAPFVFGAATAGAASLIFLPLSRGRRT
jgi:MFS family permease